MPALFGANQREKVVQGMAEVMEERLREAVDDFGIDLLTEGAERAGVEVNPKGSASIGDIRLIDVALREAAKRLTRRPKKAKAEAAEDGDGKKSSRVKPEKK